VAKAKIFISYAHADRDSVARIVAALKDVNLDVWADAQSLTPGQNWIAEIDRVLADAGYLLAILSRASITSQWVQREWTAMLGRQLDGKGGGVVIPLRLEDVDVPPLLQPIQRIDLFPDFKKGLAALVGFLLSETRPAWLVQQQRRGGQTTSDLAKDQALRAPAPHAVAYGPSEGPYPPDTWHAWHAALKHERITDPVLDTLDKKTIRRTALHCVTQQELQSFCIDAGISYGSLSGNNLNERILSLLELLIRDDRLAEFLKWLAEESPRCVEVAIRKFMPEAIPPGL
jgi:hypothetical protein